MSRFHVDGGKECWLMTRGERALLDQTDFHEGD